VVGVSLLTQQHDFYKDLEQALRRGAAERGLVVQVVSAEFDPGRQASQLEDFLARGVAAIVVSPCDSDGIVQSIRRANARGVPVFTADIAASGGDVVAHIASDNTQGGRLAAEAMARFLGEAGEVVVLDHPEVASVRDRVEGFLARIAEFPGIEVVDRPSAGGTRDKAYTITENTLQAHPDLRGIFGINDDSALGALRAAGARDLVIIGYDATPEARKAILSGSALKADVIQHPDRIGAQAIAAVADHLEGKAVPSHIKVEVGLVDRESLGARD
jgi:ribose transport system substrate-binding protein